MDLLAHSMATAQLMTHEFLKIYQSLNTYGVECGCYIPADKALPPVDFMQNAALIFPRLEDKLNTLSFRNGLGFSMGYTASYRDIVENHICYSDTPLLDEGEGRKFLAYLDEIEGLLERLSKVPDLKSDVAALLSDIEALIVVGKGLTRDDGH